MLTAATLAAAPLDAPTQDAVAEARLIVQEMQSNPRGPYLRIRWFCNDGTLQPPVAYACREHGGGRQHAQYSPQRARLSELGWTVGTIFAATTFEELFDSGLRQNRLRELPLERYLIDVDDGWILKNARDYRGRIQLEDEVAAGTALLLELLSKTEWVDENFLLARESMRTIPHGNDSDLARKVRRDAIRLAELDPAAECWRAEIHTRPDTTTSRRLRDWARSGRGADATAVARQLADDLDLLYGQSGIDQRVAGALADVADDSRGRAWRETVRAALNAAPADRLPGICKANADARSDLFPALNAAGRLALMDALQELETVIQLTWNRDLAGERHSRRQLLVLASALADCSYAAGLLSTHERESVTAALNASLDSATTIAGYRASVATLKRAPGWALGEVRHTFAEPVIAYTALDSRALRFSDDLLRGSPMAVLGEVLKELSRDADRLFGSVAEINGETAAAAVALNPGIARGTLRIFPTIEAVEHGNPQPTDIVALPEAIAELSPVAGILTLGEGNALSHVQLLARNFGIPNVAVDYEALAQLEPLDGKEVELIVASNGSVLLREAGTARADVAPALSQVEVPTPDLSVNRVLPLDRVGREMSGKIVGPKAANLGELNRLFPGRVAPAVVVPFGVYAEYVRRAGIDRRIRDAFEGIESGALSRSDFDERIASIRSDITKLSLDDETRRQIDQVIESTFGDDIDAGVFIRSDTNVEDLPQFTGAGLNETLPNVVGREAQYAGVSRVWSSIFSPRALAWRSSVLASPEKIYASVLLMKSVPSTKSGVLVTANLADRDEPGLTTSAAWGVGGAVAGEAAETVVILDESTVLLSEAKAPYQRYLAPTGGVHWLPAPAGQVLDAKEIAQLRELAAEVSRKYEPVFTDAGDERPWDIEFGFIDGELTLFQIRPLVERAGRDADELLERLLPGSVGEVDATQTVDLDAFTGTLNDA